MAFLEAISNERSKTSRNFNLVNQTSEENALTQKQLLTFPLAPGLILYAKSQE